MDRFLARLEALAPQADCCFRNEWVWALADGETGYLAYLSTPNAGAVGEAQGKALLAALESLSARRINRLILWMNSAGAHFDEPMAGLYHLNELVEGLWRLRNGGVRITAVADGWLYGGAAMAVCCVAHDIRLAEEARLGLFGHRVREGETGTPTPAPLHPNMQPPHLRLSRLPAGRLMDGI